MWSVLLLPAAAMLSDAVAKMERAGAHAAAQQLSKALDHDDPLARKLEAFASAVQRQADSVAAAGEGAAKWMQHDADLATLGAVADMRAAGRKLGLIKAPTSFVQTGSRRADFGADLSPDDFAMPATDTFGEHTFGAPTDFAPLGDGPDDLGGNVPDDDGFITPTPSVDDFMAHASADVMGVGAFVDSTAPDPSASAETPDYSKIERLDDPDWPPIHEDPPSPFGGAGPGYEEPASFLGGESLSLGDKSLDDLGLGIDPTLAARGAPDLTASSGLGTSPFDYSGEAPRDASASLASLTDQLVSDAATSDEETRAAGFTPSSLAETEPEDDPLDHASAVEAEEADEAEIDKVSKQQVKPVKQKMSDVATREAEQLGMKVPELEFVKFPLSNHFLHEREVVDDKLEQDAADEREASSLRSKPLSAEEAILFNKRVNEKLDHATRKTGLSQRVKQAEAEAQTILAHGKVAPADKAAFEADLQAAFGGGPAAVAKDERLRRRAEQNEGGRDRGAGFVEVSPSGNMRTG